MCALPRSRPRVGSRHSLTSICNAFDTCRGTLRRSLHTPRRGCRGGTPGRCCQRAGLALAPGGSRSATAGRLRLRILFIGDVVGKSGRQAIRTYLPECVTKLKVDLCVVNGENAADQGFGITEGIYEELLASGADAVTLGNHSWN